MQMLVVWSSVHYVLWAAPRPVDWREIFMKLSASANKLTSRLFVYFGLYTTTTTTTSTTTTTTTRFTQAHNSLTVNVLGTLLFTTETVIYIYSSKRWVLISN